MRIDLEWMKNLKFVLFKQDEGNHFGDINLLREEEETSEEFEGKIFINF